MTFFLIIFPIDTINTVLVLGLCSVTALNCLYLKRDLTYSPACLLYYTILYCTFLALSDNHRS